MPRVLRIMNRLNLGGPTYNACYLTKYLAPEFETLLVAGMKDNSEASSEFIAEGMGIAPRYLQNMRRELNFANDLSSFYELKKIIREYKPDIVHTHAAKSGALGRLAASALHVPVIVHTFHGHVFHSYFGKLKTEFFIKTERFLAKKCSAIVAISNKQKDELANVYKICPSEKISVIPLGFELERFRQNKDIKRKVFREKYFLKEDELAIGIVGRLVPIKNHELFLTAFKKVSEMTTKKIRAFIIGDGELRNETENVAKLLGLEVSIDGNTSSRAAVVFTSWIREIDVALAGIDIIAMSSLNEGTPVSLIEAQAAGKPIISTRTGGVEDIVMEGKTALLSENNNLVEFTEKLLLLVENEKLRNEFSVSGWKNADEKFNVSILTENMRRLYQRLLK